MGPDAIFTGRVDGVAMGPYAIEQTQHATHTQVAVHGGRVHDVFEIEAFAVAAGERGRGYGQALLAALLLAFVAAAGTSEW